MDGLCKKASAEEVKSNKKKVIGGRRWAPFKNLREASTRLTPKARLRKNLKIKRISIFEVLSGLFKWQYQEVMNDNKRLYEMCHYTGPEKPATAPKKIDVARSERNNSRGFNEQVKWHEEMKCFRIDGRETTIMFPRQCQFTSEQAKWQTKRKKSCETPPTANVAARRARRKSRLALSAIHSRSLIKSFAYFYNRKFFT